MIDTKKNLLRCANCGGPDAVDIGLATIGEAWRKDSSLEKWFPYTAEELEKLKLNDVAQKQRIAELEKALESILDGMQQMPQLNEEIVEQVMRGDNTLECEIGGDEANISSWVAIARMALKVK